MTPKRDNEFIWTNDFFFECDTCTGNRTVEEIQIELEGPDTVSFRMEAESCNTCGRQCGLLEDLYYLLDIIEWPVDSIDTFGRDEQPLDVYVVDNPNEGLMPWNEYREQDERLDFFVEPSETQPSTAAVLEYPQHEATWQFAERPLDWILDAHQRPTLGYLAVVTNEEGLILHSDLHTPARLSPQGCTAFMLHAMSHSDVLDHPQRPTRLQVDNQHLAQGISSMLAPLGIRVTHNPTPEANEALAAAVDAIRRTDHPAQFEDASDASIERFVQSARAFFSATPWERFSGNHFLGIQLGGGPWRYINVMGQMQEEFGINLFDDWLHVCRFFHNQPERFEFVDREAFMRPLEAAGNIEAVSLDELGFLNPDDAARLIDLQLSPIALPEEALVGYPTLKRITPEGYEGPQRSVTFYITLMDALTKVLRMRKQPEITTLNRTVSVRGRTVTLRLPASGTEAYSDRSRSRSYRIVFFNGVLTHDTDLPKVPLPKTIEIRLPGTATLETIKHALKRATDDRFWITGLKDPRYYVWRDGGFDESPSPPIALLMRIGNLKAEFFYTLFDARIERLPDDEAVTSVEVLVTQAEA